MGWGAVWVQAEGSMHHIGVQPAAIAAAVFGNRMEVPLALNSAGELRCRVITFGGELHPRQHIPRQQHCVKENRTEPQRHHRQLQTTPDRPPPVRRLDVAFGHGQGGGAHEELNTLKSTGKRECRQLQQSTQSLERLLHQSNEIAA